MKYLEVQAEYNGKTRMSMLRKMVVQYKNPVSFVETPSKGFQHQSADYIFKGYAGQESGQVASKIEQVFVKLKSIIHD